MWNKMKTPEELMQFMKENIAYGFVDYNGEIHWDLEDSNWVKKGIVQTGKEVLETKCGTCWDQVELERFFFQEQGKTCETYFFGFMTDKENTFPTHTMLLYEDQGHWYWFEYAWEKERGIHGYHSKKELLLDVKRRLLSFVHEMGQITKKDEVLLRCYSYPPLMHSVTVQEYVDMIVTNGTLVT